MCTRYIGGGGRYKVSCQNLIDKYTTRQSKWSQSTDRLDSLGLDVSPTSSNLGRYSKSCSNLSTLSDHDASSIRRSKSYSRITEEKSSYEQVIILFSIFSGWAGLPPLLHASHLTLFQYKKT